MGRPPCCDEVGVKKGPWTPEEDEKLVAYISKHGHGSWRTLPKNAGLNRCGKSCRLRWTNYLRPDIKRGKFTDEEERMIINLHSVLGNKWSKIAANLPGRTDNEIKNFWNTHIRKKLLQMGIDPETHKPRTDFRHLMNLTQLLGMPNLGNLMINPWGNPLSLHADVTQLAKIQLLQNLLQIMSSNNPLVNMENDPNYLFGNQSLSTPIEAILNRTNTLQNMDSILNIGQEYANSDIFPQAQTQSDRLTQLDISKSWAGLESKSNPEVLGVNNTDRSTSHENNIEAEKALPALISVSPGTSSFNQMESCSNNNTAQILSNIESPSSSNIFDAWEKLLDDETSGSYWKEILDLTSTSASPISW